MNVEVRAGLSKDYWETNWERVKVPKEHTPDKVHELDATFRRVLPRGQCRLVEIGCAPGGWMAYFARRFGYQISGLEYAPKAYQKTLDNFQRLHLDASVELGDFFALTPRPFDVVFSYGFVEHFPDLRDVVRRVAAWAAEEDGYVITCIPSLSGLNWWISRRFRPAVAAGHYPTQMADLVAAHEAAGLRTVCARFYGCLQITPPLDKTLFAQRHPRVRRALDSPFRLWNFLVNRSTGLVKSYPQIGACHTGIVYIGKRG